MLYAPLFLDAVSPSMIKKDEFDTYYDNFTCIHVHARVHNCMQTEYKLHMYIIIEQQLKYMTL